MTFSKLSHALLRCQFHSRRCSSHSVLRSVVHTKEELRLLYHIEEKDVIDDRLDKLVKRNAEFILHFAAMRMKRIHPTTANSFIRAKTFVDEFYKGSTYENSGSPLPVILDSGCGLGLSSYTLSSLYPDYPIIGVDRSLSKLKTNNFFHVSDAETSHLSDDDSSEEELSIAKMSKMTKPNNLILLQADLVDFWVLAALESQWVTHKHFLFHPNPFPKHNSIRRRFYAHPVFPILPILGGDFYLRSNWRTFAEEFRMSLSILQTSEKPSPGMYGVTIPKEVAGFDPSLILSHFDRKYVAVETPMYDLRVNFPQRNPEWRREQVNVEQHDGNR